MSTEREKFEALYPVPSKCVRFIDGGYKGNRQRDDGAAKPYQELWECWQAAWKAAAPQPAQAEPQREALAEEAKALLSEAYGFASTSPRAQENINVVLNILDCLAALPAPPVPKA